MLVSAALPALGYAKNSLLSRHAQRAYDLYGQHAGPAGQAWLKNYVTSSKKLLGHISRMPLGEQRAVHSKALHSVVKNNPKLLLSRPAHVQGFIKAIHENHNGLARHFGMPSLGAPPKVSPLARLSGVGNPGAGLGQKALGVPGAGQPQRPTAGVNTAGVPRADRQAALRASLGMDPMPPAFRHPQPLSMAPEPTAMPGAKALANPNVPASEGGLT